MRDELFNKTLLCCMDKARVEIAAWMQDYDQN
jgi:hypothetical protein